MLDEALAVLRTAGCKVRSVLMDDQAGHELPFDNGQFDLVISFYSLEHLHPLDRYLVEINRVLVPGGQLVGAIPAEGGIAWGLGRYLTTRRYFKKHTSIDPDKIICWEHPNFADQVLEELDASFHRDKVTFWPLAAAPLLDANLIIGLVYSKRNSK